MGKPSFAGVTSAIAQTLDEIGDLWILLIVEQLFAGTKCATELRQALGLSVEQFDPLLTHMIEHGFAQRLPKPQAGTIVWEYFATPKSEPLAEVLTALDRCSSAWSAPHTVASPDRLERRSRAKSEVELDSDHRVLPFARSYR